MFNKLSICAFFLGLAGCAAKRDLPIASDASAKIRVFHGTAVFIRVGTTCYGAKAQETIHAAAGGFSMIASNKKVGMPLTADTPWSYHEYIIPAGKPVTLEMYWSTSGAGLKQSCGPISASFTPELGKYYDTSMLFEGGRCSVRLRELVETSPAKAEPVTKPTTPASQCRNN